MIDLNEAADAIDDLEELMPEEMQDVNDPFCMFVSGGAYCTNVMIEECVWCSDDGSEYTHLNDLEVETPEQFKDAVLGQLELRAKLMLKFVENARSKTCLLSAKK